MKYFIQSLIAIAGAPVIAGAFGTYSPDTQTSSPIKKSYHSVAEKQNAREIKDTLHQQLPDSLDISSIFSVFSTEDTLPQKGTHTVAFPDGYTYTPTDAGNVLDILISSSDKRKINNKARKNKTASSGDVLNFMTKVYAEHGFYQSGHWDDAEDWTAITRNVILPDYDPQDFYRPVRGRVTSLYGFRPSFGRIHKGIDLAVNIGDTVRAALPGVVARVAYDPGGYGHYVVLVHNNGMETRYAHLKAPATTLGAMLSAGDPLGLGGNTGNSTGPHLHFEIRYRGTAIDPSSLFVF